MIAICARRKRSPIPMPDRDRNQTPRLRMTCGPQATIRLMLVRKAGCRIISSRISSTPNGANHGRSAERKEDRHDQDSS